MALVATVLALMTRAIELEAVAVIARFRDELVELVVRCRWG